MSDALPESGLSPLRIADNVKLEIKTDLTPQQLIAIIPDYDALIVRSSTQVTAEVIRAGKHLRVVARAGVGVDNIDTEAATQAGVIVVNAPTGNTLAAAEHTVALLLALARLIPQADAHLRGGEWKRNRFVGIEVRDKVLGSVGLGRVAQEVVQRAQGLGMRIIGYDPYVTADYAAHRGVTLADLDTLLAEADFVTIHVPLTPQTRNQFNRERLLKMKRGARLLNVARGGIVDETALVELIEIGHLAGAALDVFEHEPLPLDSPLRRSDKIILTPHLGASTVEAQEKVAEDVALQVLDVLNDRPARYAVNAPIIPPKDLEYLIPYIDLAERMGRFLKQLGAQGMRDVEVTVHGALANFDPASLNAAIIKGLLSDVAEVRVNLVNARLIAERRGLNLIEIRMHQSDSPYEAMLTLSARSGDQGWMVRGTVVQGEPHIVAINGLWIDIVAAGHLLLTGHQDRPGIIGRVGTALGQADINISFMHVGRRAPRTEPVPAGLLEEMKGWDHIVWLRAITL
ncbi:MAG TPA: phosphoglycerate dehydrogenase [Caldilineaceae bacterium]|nr:phosphoglycerate dehydrogenase [Caldilineaceae bacterium]